MRRGPGGPVFYCLISPLSSTFPIFEHSGWYSVARIEVEGGPNEKGPPVSSWQPLKIVPMRKI